MIFDFMFSFVKITIFFLREKCVELVEKYLIKLQVAYIFLTYHTYDLTQINCG